MIRGRAAYDDHQKNHGDDRQLNRSGQHCGSAEAVFAGDGGVHHLYGKHSTAVFPNTKEPMERLVLFQEIIRFTDPIYKCIGGKAGIGKDAKYGKSAPSAE